MKIPLLPFPSMMWIGSLFMGFAQHLLIVMPLRFNQKLVAFVYNCMKAKIKKA